MGKEDGHLDGIHILVTINSAAVNTGVDAAVFIYYFYPLKK